MIVRIGPQGLGPGSQDAVDGRPDSAAGILARETGHQQGVIVRILVPDRCNHGHHDRLLIQRTTGRGAADPAAAPQTSVLGDHLGPFGRTAREELLYFPGEMGLQLHILLRPAYSVTLAAAHPGVLVGQTLLLRTFEGRFLDENTLALVSFPGPTPPHDHRR